MNERYSVPISVKGIVFEDEKIWLRKNERNEWELPGGKLNEGEQPNETVVRELQEELGLETTVVDLVHVHLYKIKTTDESRGVLVICYLCSIIKKVGDFEHLGEAGLAEFKLFSLQQIQDLAMPDFYKDAVEHAVVQARIRERFV